MKIKIDDATREQLLHFAKSVLQLDIKDGARLSTIRSMVQTAGFDGDEIDVPDEIAVAPTPMQSPAEPAKGNKGAIWHKITLQQSEKDNGDWPVPVIVNGSRVDLPRGVEVPVLGSYLEALQNAQYSVFEQRDKEIVERKVPRFPFSYHGVISADEVPALRAKAQAYESARRG